MDSGRFISYTNLGDVNNHLTKLEASLNSDGDTSPPLAKSTVVIMIRGMFSKLQFPYAQFPCCALSGDQLYDPFWEAVGRVENCGLKVYIRFHSVYNSHVVLHIWLRFLQLQLMGVLLIESW